MKRPNRSPASSSPPAAGLSLSRRSVLRGAGAMFALPFLESLAPRRARAQSATLGSPLKFFGYYVPCGMRMDTFTPVIDGFDFPLPPTLEPLAPVRDDIIVMSGLHNYAADDQGDGAGGHARGTSTFLTCTHPAKNRIYNNTSLDQLIAQMHGNDTRLPSLELGCEAGPEAGNCDSGYACAYQRTIAWAAPHTPLEKEVSPRAVFDRLFGADILLSPEERSVRRRQDLSLLDFVTDETSRLKTRLGARDRIKLDQYTTGIRELEKRIEAGDQDLARCPIPGSPPGGSADTGEYVRQMLDLAVLAFQCDLTRVATFMVANGATGRAYPHLGVASAHHELSHHQNQPAKLEGLLTINRWEVAEFGYLLERLKGIEEEGPNGEPVSALYNTVAMFGSELTDGDAHNLDNMPILLGGQGGGFLATGQHVKCDHLTPMANLHYTIATHYGISLDRFGDDGEDILPQILA